MTPPGTPLTAGNARVKETRKLGRRSVRAERRLFLADGPNAVEAALTVDGCVTEVFATPEARERYADLLGDTPVTSVDDRALASLSDSATPAGVVAVCRFLDVPLADMLKPGSPTVETRVSDRPAPDPPHLLAICADVRDPGNAGTVIRTADAAGATGVVLAGDSVDAYNPKTVRATVGSLFHLPVAIERDPAAAVRAARDAGLATLAADGGGEVDLFEAGSMLERPTAWLFGNEVRGLPDDLLSSVDHVVRIPILGAAESLNLSTAAALCLYASARARR